jgi:hypothetical protein
MKNTKLPGSKAFFISTTRSYIMAKLIDDPKVQELLAKAGDKASKEQDKAVKAETKRNLETVKSTVSAQVDAAKAAGNKDVAKALAQLGKDLAAAIKSPI